MIIEFEATISSSYLTEFNDKRAPHGSTLYGLFTYDEDIAVKIGGDYYFQPGETFFSVYTDEGFSLNLSNRVTAVAPTSLGDYVTVQSFVSEEPNGWNMFVDLFALDWLGGLSALPTSFDTSFATAYVSLYFTDEGNWLRTIEAQIETIAAVDTADLAQDDTFSAATYGSEWVRVAALNNGTDLLENDFRGTSVVSIEINGQTYAADGTWRDAEGGGQVRVFQRGSWISAIKAKLFAMAKRRGSPTSPILLARYPLPRQLSNSRRHFNLRKTMLTPSAVTLLLRGRVTGFVSLLRRTTVIYWKMTLAQMKLSS